MLAFIYLDIMCHSNFVIITVLITYTIAIYYTVKSIIIYQKMKKQYYINSMKEIIKNNMSLWKEDKTWKVWPALEEQN